MENFDHIVRISKLLSRNERVKDINAKIDIPTKSFTKCCATVIQLDPKAPDAVKNGAMDMLRNIKKKTVLFVAIKI